MESGKSKKRVLITGSNGLLGQHLLKQFKTANYEILATSAGPNRISSFTGNYRSLDLSNPSEVTAIVSDFKPDIVINAGAFTNVDACEDRKEECDAVNHRAVQYFLDAFDALSITPHFIQLSTDFIFDGTEREYSEEDEPSPISEYGKSKYKAEQILLGSSYQNYVIIRTSLVYGIGEALVKGNIFSWAMKKLRLGELLTIVDDQFRSPTYVEDLAWSCEAIAAQQFKGIINVAGPEVHSMYEYILMVAKYVGVKDDQVKPIKSAELAQKAKRPASSGLSIKKAKRALNYHPTSFLESLTKLDV